MVKLACSSMHVALRMFVKDQFGRSWAEPFLVTIDNANFGTVSCDQTTESVLKITNVTNTFLNYVIDFAFHTKEVDCDSKKMDSNTNKDIYAANIWENETKCSDAVKSLVFDSCSGRLAPHCSKSIHIKFLPQHRGYYRYTFMVYAIEDRVFEEAIENAEKSKIEIPTNDDTAPSSSNVSPRQNESQTSIQNFLNPTFNLGNTSKMHRLSRNSLMDSNAHSLALPVASREASYVSSVQVGGPSENLWLGGFQIMPEGDILTTDLYAGSRHLEVAAGGADGNWKQTAESVDGCVLTNVVDILSNVVQPCIRPLGAVSLDSSAGISSSLLWERLQLGHISRFFSEEPSAKEVLFRKGKGFDTKREALSSLHSFTCDLGGGCWGAPAREIVISIENPTDVDVDIQTYLPWDLELKEVPIWAKDLDISAALSLTDDAHFRFVQAKQIIQGMPKKLTLAPKEIGHLRLTLVHSHVGIHALPLVLEVASGRVAILYLHGRTFPPQRPILSTRSSVVELQPAPLGMRPGSVHCVELRNEGCAPAHWKLDNRFVEMANILGVNPNAGVPDDWVPTEKEEKDILLARLVRLQRMKEEYSQQSQSVHDHAHDSNLSGHNNSVSTSHASPPKSFAVPSFPVFEVTPSHGVIAPGESTYVHIIFTPLRLGVSTCRLRFESTCPSDHPALVNPPLVEDPITGKYTEWIIPPNALGGITLNSGYEGDHLFQELSVDVNAEGTDPTTRMPVVDSKFDSLCPLQTPRAVPGSAATLSLEMVRFENLPLRAVTEQVVILANTSDKITILPCGASVPAAAITEASELLRKARKGVIGAREEIQMIEASKDFSNPVFQALGLAKNTLSSSPSLSKQHARGFKFQWSDQRLFAESGVLEVAPSSGYLNPGEFCLVSVKLGLTDQPLEIEGEIRCDISWDPHFNNTAFNQSYLTHAGSTLSKTDSLTPGVGPLRATRGPNDEIPMGLKRDIEDFSITDGLLSNNKFAGEESQKILFSDNSRQHHGHKQIKRLLPPSNYIRGKRLQSSKLYLSSAVQNAPPLLNNPLNIPLFLRVKVSAGDHHLAPIAVVHEGRVSIHPIVKQDAKNAALHYSNQQLANHNILQRKKLENNNSSPFNVNNNNNKILKSPNRSNPPPPLIAKQKRTSFSSTSSSNNHQFALNSNLNNVNSMSNNNSNSTSNFLQIDDKTSPSRDYKFPSAPPPSASSPFGAATLLNGEGAPKSPCLVGDEPGFWASSPDGLCIPNSSHHLETLDHHVVIPPLRIPNVLLIANDPPPLSNGHVEDIKHVMSPPANNYHNSVIMPTTHPEAAQLYNNSNIKDDSGKDGSLVQPGVLIAKRSASHLRRGTLTSEELPPQELTNPKNQIANQDNYVPGSLDAHLRTLADMNPNSLFNNNNALPPNFALSPPLHQISVSNTNNVFRRFSIGSAGALLGDVPGLAQPESLLGKHMARFDNESYVPTNNEQTTTNNGQFLVKSNPMLISEVFSSVIRSVFEDFSFLEVVDQILKEPAPIHAKVLSCTPPPSPKRLHDTVGHQWPDENHARWLEQEGKSPNYTAELRPSVMMASMFNHNNDYRTSTNSVVDRYAITEGSPTLVPESAPPHIADKAVFMSDIDLLLSQKEEKPAVNEEDEGLSEAEMKKKTQSGSIIACDPLCDFGFLLDENIGKAWSKADADRAEALNARNVGFDKKLNGIGKLANMDVDLKSLAVVTNTVFRDIIRDVLDGVIKGLVSVEETNAPSSFNLQPILSDEQNTSKVHVLSKKKLQEDDDASLVLSQEMIDHKSQRGVREGSRIVIQPH